MDFVADLSLSDDKKNNSYNSIVVVIDCLIKIIYYKSVMTTIDAVGLIGKLHLHQIYLADPRSS